MDSMTRMLRALGAPEEVIKAFVGSSADERVSNLFREMERAIDGHMKSVPPTGNRTEDSGAMALAWRESMVDGFTNGGTSFNRLAEVMGAMEYRIRELEDTLRRNGYEVPREPSPEEMDTMSSNGKRCIFCGGNH